MSEAPQPIKSLGEHRKWKWQVQHLTRMEKWSFEDHEGEDMLKVLKEYLLADEFQSIIITQWR